MSVHIDSDAGWPLAHPPIVEAVVDIDCDLPPGFVLAEWEERGRQRFREGYWIFQRTLRQSGTPGAKALQFRGAKPQMVQMRLGGFSFNRFAPYTVLDDYLPEIRRTWEIYRELVSPIAVVQIRLRFINRIGIPYEEGRAAELGDYLNFGLMPPAGPLPLELTSVLNQYTAVEPERGHEVSVRLAINESVNSQSGRRAALPVIFDIAAVHRGNADPGVWDNIQGAIESLRETANAIFRNSVTKKCLDLFR